MSPFLSSFSVFFRPAPSFALHSKERSAVPIAHMKLNGLASEHVTGQLLTEVGLRLNKLRIPIPRRSDDPANLDRAVRAGDMKRLRPAIEDTDLDQILSQL